MTHLRIELNSNVEIVNSLIIQKLYECALSILEPSEGLYDNVYVSGNIQSNYAYLTHVSYLTRRFPTLLINVTLGYYILFEDPTVAQYAIWNNGDGVGCTYLMAAGVTTRNAFWGNSMSSSLKALVTSLNDFQYFTGTRNCIDEGFALIEGFSNATSIKFPDVAFSYDYIWGRTIVAGNFSTIDYGDATFSGPTNYNQGLLLPIANNTLASQWDPSYLPKQNAYHRVKLFANWTLITKIIFPEGKTEMWENYEGCQSLLYVEYPSTTSIMGNGLSLGNNGAWIPCIVVKAVTPPSWIGWDSQSTLSIWGTSGLGYFRCPEAIYVPDNSVTAYKSVTNNGTTNESVWANPSVQAVIKPMSIMPLMYRNMGTVTQADIDRV